MATREFVNAYSAGHAYDNGENDVVMLFISGPRGGTKIAEPLSALQARNLRDNLDIALLKIGDARARTPVYVVVENAGYEGEKDVFEAKTFDEASAWMTKTYSAESIDRLHIAVARDIAGQRSYEL
jgi:hypothetical protein